MSERVREKKIKMWRWTNICMNFLPWKSLCWRTWKYFIHNIAICVLFEILSKNTHFCHILASFMLLKHLQFVVDVPQVNERIRFREVFQSNKEVYLSDMTFRNRFTDITLGQCSVLMLQSHWNHWNVRLSEHNWDV